GGRRARWWAYSYREMWPARGVTWHWYPRAPHPPADLMTMHDPPAYILAVNQNFYQYHRTNDLRRFTPGTALYEEADKYGVVYSIPYLFKPAPRRVVVVGAGGGLDVEGALLPGAPHVDPVDIAPLLPPLTPTA